MHDFPSDAFGRSITLQELPFWSQIDLQTLKSELKARIKEINLKIDHHRSKGIFNKRELSARTYLQVFLNKATEELSDRQRQNMLDKARDDLAIAKKQVREERDFHLATQFRLLKFQTLLSDRFGKDVIQEIAEEAIRLTPNS